MEPRFLRTGGKRIHKIIGDRRWDHKRQFGPLGAYYKRVSTIYWRLRSVTAVSSKTRGSEYSMTKRAHILSRRIPGHHTV